MTSANQPPLTVVPEETPNPASVKFCVNRRLLDGAGYDFPSPSAASSSPLATKLFANEQVRGVYIGPGFVTITADLDADWFALADYVTDALRNHIESGEPVLVAPDGRVLTPHAKSESEIEAGIVAVLDGEIRPAVAMDGGDVTFAGYSDGVVQLRLRGACSGCPSARMTLKMGIESRLRELFPEIVAVEAV